MFLGKLSVATVALALAGGCQTFESYRYCSELPPAQLAALSTRLSDTGLLSIRFNDHVGAGLTVTIPVAGALPVVPALGFAMTGHLERTAP